MNPFDIRSAVEEADVRIRPHVLETQLRRSDHLSRLTGANILCKLENLQVTGSFKARGAANKIASLSTEQRMRGVVTASSGNHGAAVAVMLARFGGHGVVYVPTITPKVKVDAIRDYGAEVRFHSEDSGEAEIFARAYAEAEGLTYVAGQTLKLPDKASLDLQFAGDIKLGIRPEYVILSHEQDPSALPAKVMRWQDCGTYQLLTAQCGVTPLKARLRPDIPALSPGKTVWLSVMGEHTCFYKNEELLA